MNIDKESHMKRMQGVTLLELMIVISIIGVMASIAAPSMTAFINQTRLNSVLSLLRNDLQTARSEAIKRNIRVTVCASNATQTDCGGNRSWATNGWLICPASGVACDTSLAAIAIRPPVASPISVTAGSADSVIYRPVGVVVASQSISLGGGTGAPGGVLSIATTGAISYVKN
jgi:type IV fimbrial biogenesis protein FimT